MKKDSQKFPQELLLAWDKLRVFTNPRARGAKLLMAQVEEVEEFIRFLTPLEAGILQTAAAPDGYNLRQLEGIVPGYHVVRAQEAFQLVAQPRRNGLYHLKKEGRDYFFMVRKPSVGGLSYCYQIEVRKKRKEKPIHAENQECCV